jgi:hypothetical protein
MQLIVTGNALLFLFVDFLVLGFGLALGLAFGNWLGAAILSVPNRASRRAP